MTLSRTIFSTCIQFQIWYLTLARWFKDFLSVWLKELSHIYTVYFRIDWHVITTADVFLVFDAIAVTESYNAQIDILDALTKASTPIRTTYSLVNICTDKTEIRTKMCRDVEYDRYLLGVNCTNFNGSSFSWTTTENWSSALHTVTVLSSLSSLTSVCYEWTIGCKLRLLWRWWLFSIYVLNLSLVVTLTTPQRSAMLGDSPCRRAWWLRARVTGAT